MLQRLWPVLVPSWRFFDTIGPAPRLEWARAPSGAAADAPVLWQEFRPLPERRGLAAVLASLVWAPRRNQTLFLLGCAERLMERPSAALEARLLAALRDAALSGELPGTALGDDLYVRIVVTQRDGGSLRELEVWRRLVSAGAVA
jgi:hypothetical protein